MSFDKLSLHPNLLQAIEASGYQAPTPIQANAIPIVLAGDDLIGIAGTGTGKTAAFMLPALQRLNESRANASGRRTRILVLSPTRELAQQITTATVNFAKFGGRTSIANIIGGISYRKQAGSLSPAPDIIVATPGRLIDYLQNKQINLSQIEMLILDEADRMLDMGFIDDVKRIIQAAPADCQKLMFSATFDNTIANFARTVLKNPKQVSIAKEAHQKAAIEQRIYMAHDVQHKTQLLSNLLASENVYKAIIFSATKRGADKLAKQLNEQGYQASELHGDMRQNQRNAVIDKMRKDKIQFLVATDVAARGIDIAGITHVFNFDFPTFAEDYVHRIGRTGRAGKTGVAISLVLSKEMRHIKQVERYTGQNLSVIKDKNAAPSASRHSHAESAGSTFNRNNSTRSEYRPARRADSRNDFAAPRTGDYRTHATSSRDGNFKSRATTSRYANAEGNTRFARSNNARSDFTVANNRNTRSGSAPAHRTHAETGTRFARNGNTRSDFAAPRSNNYSGNKSRKGPRNNNVNKSSSYY
jgi:superfamily II DNA/RNA helicase